MPRRPGGKRPKSVVQNFVGKHRTDTKIYDPKPVEPESVDLPLTTRPMFVQRDVATLRLSSGQSLVRDAPPPPPGYRYTLDGRCIPLMEIEMDIKDPQTQIIFLDIIEKTGSLRAACDAIGMDSHQDILIFMRHSPSFASQLESSVERHRQQIYQAAFNRGVHGYEVPIIGGKNKDEVVAYERRYSDSLLLAMLKRHFPEFREQSRAAAPALESQGVVPLQVETGRPDMRGLPRSKRDEIMRALKSAPKEVDAKAVIDVEDLS